MGIDRYMTYWLIEYARKDKEEDDIQEINNCNGDIKGVRLFVHPRSENAGADESDCFDNDKSNSLNR